MPGELCVDRDAPCPTCAYNLRGLRQNTCPECGRAFDLHVLGVVDRDQPYPWRALVAALPIGLGFLAAEAALFLGALGLFLMATG